MAEQPTAHPSAEHCRVCPWYIGYLLINPLRRLFQDPRAILSPYVREGMTVLEIGPGMGYFSLPLARLVGAGGRVICVDVQQKMLDSLHKRAAKAGLAERITPVLASEDSLHLEPFREAVDFALAFAVVHEVPDQSRLFEQISGAMKQGGRLLLSEPRGHVDDQAFGNTLRTASKHGLKFESSTNIRQSLSAILLK